MKNILIMGIGRAGKTTLSNIIKDRYNSYNIVHSDSLKWALIRAKGQEKYYREKVNIQKEFEHSEYFQRVLLEFYNSLIRNDIKGYGTILESGQLHPKLVREMIDFNTTNVICLGLGNLNKEQIVDLCFEHDTEKDWTYGLKREYIAKHAENWYKRNEMLKKECPKYGIKYVDTSVNRLETLNNLANDMI